MVEWSEGTIMAVGGAIAVVIGAIVAGFIKISEIHKIVNSRDTALRAELNAGKSEIEALKLTVQELTRDKADMRAEAAMPASPSAPTPTIQQVEIVTEKGPVEVDQTEKP